MNKEFLVPTGSVLTEYFEYYELNFSELPNLIGISKTDFNKLLKGKYPLSRELAFKINSIIPDIPASYWINYEARYQNYLKDLKKEAIDLSKEELKIISKRFRFNTIFKGLDWDIERQAREMLSLLELKSFADFEDAYSNLIVDFMEDGGEKEAISIWLKLCEEEIYLQNRDISSINYNNQLLKDSLNRLKSIALNSDYKNSINSARKLLNRLGIYLVFLAPIENSKVRGALTTFEDHPAIYLSGRFKTHDHVWFALLHEIGHLILHYKKGEALISFEDEGLFTSNIDIKEQEANEFARNFFIDKLQYENFISNCVINEKTIREFADLQRVLPGIVVARLQHDGIISYEKFNYLKGK